MCRVLGGHAVSYVILLSFQSSACSQLTLPSSSWTLLHIFLLRLCLQLQPGCHPVLLPLDLDIVLHGVCYVPLPLIQAAAALSLCGWNRGGLLPKSSHC
jgi:hypothetical protein